MKLAPHGRARLGMYKFLVGTFNEWFFLSLLIRQWISDGSIPSPRIELTKGYPSIRTSPSVVFACVETIYKKVIVCMLGPPTSSRQGRGCHILDPSMIVLLGELDGSGHSATHDHGFGGWFIDVGSECGLVVFLRPSGPRQNGQRK